MQGTPILFCIVIQESVSMALTRYFDISKYVSDIFPECPVHNISLIENICRGEIRRFLQE